MTKWEIPLGLFNKAYEIYEHSLNYDKKLAFYCEKCSQELDTKHGECEEDFMDICK